MWSRNLRHQRSRQVALTQQRVYGLEPIPNKTGDKPFRRPLEGEKLLKQYFPSKFAFQSFHAEEYYEM